MRWLIASLIGSAYVAGSIALAKWSGTPMPHDPNPVWFDAMLYLSCELAVSWLIWASWNARRAKPPTLRDRRDEARGWR